MIKPSKFIRLGLALSIIQGLAVSAQANPAAMVGRISQPVSLQQAGVDPEALKYALACNEKFQAVLKDSKADLQKIILADYSLAMEEPRLFVIEYNRKSPQNSTVLLRTWVSHGSGSGRVDASQRTSPTRRTYAKILTDVKATQTTPAGCFRVFGRGEAGIMSPPNDMLKGFYVSGLERINECAHTKGIRIHEYPLFKNPVRLQPNQWMYSTVTNSAGCMRVDSQEILYLKKHINPTEGNLLVNCPGQPRANPESIETRAGLQFYTQKSAMEFENETLAYQGAYPNRVPIDNTKLTKSKGRNCETDTAATAQRQTVQVIPKRQEIRTMDQSEQERIRAQWSKIQIRYGQ